MTATYTVYKGDEIRCTGTEEECAAAMGVTISTLRHYATPTHQERVAKRKSTKNSTIVIREKKRKRVVHPPGRRYIVYKGDDIECMGTDKECADYMGIQLKTFWHYLTPAYKERVRESETREVKRKSRGFKVVLPMNDYIQDKLN